MRKGKKRVRTYVRALRDSDTKTEAKLAAGYSPATSTKQIESSKAFKQFQAELQKKIPDSEEIKVYKEAMKARKSGTYLGRTYESKTPDHLARVLAVKEVSKLKGHYKQLEGGAEPAKIEIEVRE